MFALFLGSTDAAHKNGCLLVPAVFVLGVVVRRSFFEVDCTATCYSIHRYLEEIDHHASSKG